MPTKMRAASQRNRRGEEVAKIAVDTEGEHGGIVVVEMEVGRQIVGPSVPEMVVVEKDISN